MEFVVEAIDSRLDEIEDHYSSIMTLKDRRETAARKGSGSWAPTSSPSIGLAAACGIRAR
jgi:hypothetical protein